jgi:chaperone-like protein
VAESRNNRTAGAARLLRKAAGTVLTGVVGVVVVRAAERGQTGSLPRRLAVGATTWGIRGARRAEVAVERTRLAAGDVRAEAYAALGEQVPPPVDRTGAGHDHQH